MGGSSNTFYYDGIPRIQLWFDNPNKCGFFLVVILLFFSACCSLAPAKMKYGKVMRYVLQAGVFICLHLIMLTYSRGAYLATIAGLLFALGTLRKKALFVYLVFFISFLLFIPQNLKRVASCANISEGSIWNRILLWKGTCGTIAAFPIKGVSLNHVGAWYSAWHQPLSLEAAYLTAQNDILTFTAAYGMPLAFVVLSFFIWLTWANSVSLKTISNPLRRIAVCHSIAAFVAMAVAGCFNTFFSHVACWWLAIVPFMIMLHNLSIIKLKKNILKPILPSCIVSACLLGIVFIYGKRKNDQLSYIKEKNPTQNSVDYNPILVPKDDAKGEIHYLIAEEDLEKMSDIEVDNARQRLRPAAESGYKCRTIYFARNATWKEFEERIKHNDFTSACPQVIIADCTCSELLLQNDIGRMFPENTIICHTHVSGVQIKTLPQEYVHLFFMSPDDELPDMDNILSEEVDKQCVKFVRIPLYSCFVLPFREFYPHVIEYLEKKNEQ